MDIIKKYKIDKKELIVIIVLSLFRAGSMFFYLDEKEMLVSGRWSIGNYLAFLSHFLLAFVVLYFVVICFDALIKIYKNYSTKQDTTKVFIPDGKKYFGFNCLFLAIGWLPHLIIRYPGAVCIDTWVMFEEYFGYGLSEAHSVFYTTFMGRLLVIFNKLGSVNAGMYFFVIVHYFVYVAAFAYMFNVLRKYKVPNIYLLVVRLFCLLNPLIIGYIGVAIKDSLYSALFVAAFMFFLDFYIERDKAQPKYKYILFVLTIVFACLTRRNGLYIFILLVGTVFFIKEKNVFKNSIKIFGVSAILIFFVISMFYKIVYMPAPAVSEELLSYPFQQTARYVRDYPDDVTDEEREVIDAVFTYDTLAGRYDPRISDPVKNISYIEGYEWAYFKVWCSQLLKHPMCYVDATMEQNYYFFVPEVASENTAFFMNGHVSYEYQNRNEVDSYTQWFNSPEWLKPVQEWSVRLYKSLYHVPVMALLWNTSLATYFVVLAIMKVRHKRDGIVMMTPFMLTLGLVFFGPVCQGHPRYMMSIMYCLPAIIAFVLYVGSMKHTNKEVKKSVANK